MMMVVMVVVVMVLCRRAHAWQTHAWQVRARDAARPARETFNLLLNPFTAEIFPPSSRYRYLSKARAPSHGREKFENIAAF